MYCYQLLSDSASRFSVIHIGACGKQSDGGTFSASTLYHFLEDFESALPNPASFEGSETEMPLVILGDEGGLSSKDVLIEPFRERGFVM